jgi:hypothetical protein
MVSSERAVRIVIDARLISETDDPMVVIDPVWWTADFYEDIAKYEASLSKFSRPQRHVLAVLWYDSEVCNGGHSQFYSNSTGMVWRDALAALLAIPLSEAHDILQESARRLGGTPSFDRTERNTQLDVSRANFGDLDDRYYEFIREIDLGKRVMTYIRRHAQDFYFAGDVVKPVP